MGMKAIVQKNVQIGDIGILFPTESQLSEKFCTMNNIYRHEHLNKNPAIKGYIEDSRRVKAVKFRGNESNALFMPLESLSYLNFDITTLHVGDKFNEIG
jgi:hypothetical protein